MDQEQQRIMISNLPENQQIMMINALNFYNSGHYANAIILLENNPILQERILNYLENDDQRIGTALKQLVKTRGVNYAIDCISEHPKLLSNLCCHLAETYCRQGDGFYLARNMPEAAFSYALAVKILDKAEIKEEPIVDEAVAKLVETLCTLRAVPRDREEDLDDIVVTLLMLDDFPHRDDIISLICPEVLEQIQEHEEEAAAPREADLTYDEQNRYRDRLVKRNEGVDTAPNSCCLIL